MGEQNSRCASSFGPSDIPVGATLIDVSSTDMALNPTCRGIDCVTAGNFVVVYANGDTQTVPMTAGQRWSGHIKQITKTGTTGTGYVLK
jgi:hypothetical protein